MYFHVSVPPHQQVSINKITSWPCPRRVYITSGQLDHSLHIIRLRVLAHDWPYHSQCYNEGSRYHPRNNVDAPSTR